MIDIDYVRSFFGVQNEPTAFLQRQMHTHTHANLSTDGWRQKYFTGSLATRCDNSTVGHVCVCLCLYIRGKTTEPLAKGDGECMGFSPAAVKINNVRRMHSYCKLKKNKSNRYHFRIERCINFAIQTMRALCTWSGTMCRNEIRPFIDAHRVSSFRCDETFAQQPHECECERRYRRLINDKK